MSESSEIFKEDQLIRDGSTSRIEKLRELNENEEFIGFLEEYYQFKELHYRSKGFMVGKNSFCQDIKGQHIFPASFSLKRLTISIVEQQESIDEEEPWYSNIKFMAGNMPTNILIKPSGMQIKSGYSMDKNPRQLDLKYAPKLLAGLVSASADANNFTIWNQEELKEIEELNEVEPNQTPELLKDLVGSLADIDGDCSFNVQTPVLVNDSGVGMQVRLTESFNQYTSASDLKIDMATENPLGILVYSFGNSSFDESEENISYVSRQAIDGHVRDMELDVDLYGYKPTIINPETDKKTFDHITHSLDTTLCGFIRDLEAI